MSDLSQGPATSGQRWLSGIVPPVCTPMDERSEVDTVSLERHINFLLGAGVHGLFMLGSSSEVAYLTDAQRDRVVEIAVKTCGGEVPVLVGAIDMTTSRVIDHALRAKERGADAIVLTQPFYAMATQPGEVRGHFRAVKERTELPLVAYDIPVAVHSKMNPALMVELAQEGLIQAMKDSSGDIHGFRGLVAATRDVEGFSLFTGSELVVDCALYLGGDGAVPGLCNVDPHGYVSIYDAAIKGDWATAKAVQDRLYKLFSITAMADSSTKGPNASGLGGFKTALMLRRIFDHNFMGLPQVPLDEQETEKVRKVLADQGLI